MNIEAELERLRKEAARIDKADERIGSLPGIRESNVKYPKIYVEGGKRWRPFTIKTR